MTATPNGSPPRPELSVEVEAVGRWLTVELRGELDAATAPVLVGRVALLILQEMPPWIALELSQVNFCDSSGINVFVRLWKRTVAAGGQLVLLSPRPPLAEVLNRIGLDGHVRVLDTLPTATGDGSAAGAG